MQIRILGCSGGIGPGLRTTSLLVDDCVLIDAGTGVGDLSLAEMGRIGDVFLTHSHLDHVCGLAFMADNLFDENCRPVRVYALPVTLQTLRDHLFNWKLWPDFTQLPDAERALLRFEPLEPALSCSIGSLRLTAFEVCHTVPAVGYIVDDGQSVFAFTGDTCADERLWQALNELRRLDHLMIEVAFPDGEAELGRLSRHFTPAVLGHELRRLRHRPMLHLTHAKPGLESLIEQECRVALDGWQYRHLRTGDIIRV
jgi:cAMP phosphodiesterase